MTKLSKKHPCAACGRSSKITPRGDPVHSSVMGDRLCHRCWSKVPIKDVMRMIRDRKEVAK